MLGRRRIETRSFGLLLTILLAGSLPVVAMPAAEVIYEIEQPDGSLISVLNKGDEWGNWVEKVEGFAVAPDRAGYWYYVIGYTGGEARLSNVRADAPAPAGLARGLRPKAFRPRPAVPEAAAATEAVSAAPYGFFTGPVLFILAEYDDRAGSTTEGTWATFISANIAGFYSETSHGNVVLTAASETSGTADNGVVDWVNIGSTHPNTGGNTNDQNRQLAKDAIVAADPSVNYAAFDTNFDTIVDSDELAVVVIVAGYEESFSSNFDPSVWGHQWSFWGAVAAPTVDGVTVGDYNAGAGGYAQFGELHRSTALDQHQATMGIMVHEVGHLIFGLPDLYDTDSSSSGIGGFGVMGGGSWGRKTTDSWSGETPVLASAWTRVDRGWDASPEANGGIAVVAAGSGAATSANTVFRVSPDSNAASQEYFLIENRQPMGYDQGLERWLGAGFGGMAIWHIDDGQTDNEEDRHRWVDLEEADGTLMLTTRGEATDLWYDPNATTFAKQSNPNSNLYNFLASGISIDSISVSGDPMTASVANTGTSAIPTLSGWGMVLLALLLISASWFLLRRRGALTTRP